MKTQGRTKSWTVLGALLLLGTLLTGSAKAADMDSLTVTITPTASYAVDIDTAISPALLNLGSVGLGQSTYTVNVTTVEVQSSYASTQLQMAAEIIDGTWTIDNDTTTANTDALQAWAVFTDTSIVSATVVQGLAGAYGAPDLLFNDLPQYIGDANGGTRHEVDSGAAGYKNMDNHVSSLAGDVPASRSHLWLKFILPPVSTTMTAKQVYITVAAGAPQP